jgi:hypothetical protein
MRPCSVYAKRSCPAGDPCDLLGLLHGPHRVGCRLVMILERLAQAVGQPASHSCEVHTQGPGVLSECPFMRG